MVPRMLTGLRSRKHISSFELVRPANLDAARRALSAPGRNAVMAGGIDLIDRLKLGEEVDRVILLAGVRELASPSMVVTERPSTENANVLQAETGAPSTITVQAPHTPSSQPTLQPFRMKCSRSRSAKVTFGATVSFCALPLSVNEIATSFTAATPA